MAEYPHCDQDVLHAPQKCEYCDEFPQKQQHRLDNFINFTGEDDKTKYRCPSDAKRGLGGAHVWGGNTPKPVGCNCGLFQMDPCPKHPIKSPQCTCGKGNEMTKETKEKFTPEEQRERNFIALRLTHMLAEAAAYAAYFKIPIGAFVDAAENTYREAEGLLSLPPLEKPEEVTHTKSEPEVDQG